MRQIKFRAWDKEYNEMKHVFNPVTHGEQDYFAFSEHFENSDYDIMQFTGLTDKNGKDIYEGDIVNKYATETTVGGYKRGDLMVVALVIYTSSVCGFVLRKGIDFMLSSEDHNEVIGNIHENPELLKL